MTLPTVGTVSPADHIATSAAAAIRVLAGPGTGKSFAMKQRITHLLKSGVPPEKILAITFTNMSADDLRRDIQSLKVDGAKDVHARTLHSHCYRVLNRREVIEHTGRHPRAMADYELKPLRCDLRLSGEFGDLHAIRGRIHAYEAAWARLQRDEPIASSSEIDTLFEDSLRDWMVFHRAMLIGELVPWAYKYLSDDPESPDLLEYSHVLVDEYQDLNRAEQEIAKLLATNATFLIVGDDDQSIYSFKHAHPAGIREFQFGVKHEDHTLDECRRSPRLVVEMANALITRNRGRSKPPRQLKVSPKNGDGEVAVYRFSDAKQEADYLSHLVAEEIDGGTPIGQIIVLCNSRHLARVMADTLEQRNVPTRFCYREAEVEESASAERVGMLRLAADFEDRVSLRYVLGFGATDWRARQWRSVMATCQNEGVAPWELLKSVADDERKLPGISALVKRFQAVRGELELLAGLKGQELLVAWLGEDEDQHVALRELANDVGGDESLEPRALAEALGVRLGQPAEPEEVAEVRVMSLHKSKGLSANLVIIMGCIEGILPRDGSASTPAEAGENLEEQRRLLYVGVTRVKADPDAGRPGKLVLSSARMLPFGMAMQCGAKFSGGDRRSVSTTPSRFLRELGPSTPRTVNPAAPL